MDTYEKKYNEALKWMRELYPGLHGATKEDAEHYFPELRESEDERIRKEIISALKFANDGGVYDKHIAYLEKQKERKPEIKYVYPKFRKGDVIEPITPNGHYVPVRIVGIWDGSYSCRSDDGNAYLSLPIKHEDEYRLVEQKPAWSEEDELMRTVIIQTLERFGGRGTTGMQIDWLKSLRPSWKPSEEAVEGLFQNTPFPTICLDDCKDYNFKDGDKVRVIIVKEDCYETR